MEAAKHLHKFDKPVLLAWSKEDPLFPAEHATRLSKIFPNAQVKFIDDSYCYASEDNPEALIEAIDDFLSKSKK